MNLQEIYANAKNVTTTCKVCSICNGMACRGQIPGVGGKGLGNSFVSNYQKIHDIKINLDTICEDGEIDTSSYFFEHKVTLPVYAAPIAGIKPQYGCDMSEYDFAHALLKGAIDFGTYSFLGDNINLGVFKDISKALDDFDGLGVPTIKPWQEDAMFTRFDMLSDNVIALATDVDASGLVFLKNTNPSIRNLSIDDLKVLKEKWNKPLIIKGIMTVEGAMKALEANADGIIVSNHGGRVLDDTLATIEVLHDICNVVGNKMKVFVDGGFRSGVDVFKALALGANGVLIGRPLALMALSGKDEGVRLYLEKIQTELIETMMMTGCKTISDITIEKICF